jgi:hypothetical protein
MSETSSRMKSQVKKEGAGPVKRTVATKKAVKKAGSARQNTQRGKELSNGTLGSKPSPSPHAKSGFNKPPSAKLKAAGKNNKRK